MRAYLFAVCVCVFVVCCVAVRNCLECRQRHRDRGNKSSIPNNNKTQEILLNAATSSKVGCDIRTSVSVPIVENFIYSIHAFYCKNTLPHIHNVTSLVMQNQLSYSKHHLYSL